ncbi:MAG: nicotinate phosphoribosyltransferase [Verrucomicrobiota bacterium]
MKRQLHYHNPLLTDLYQITMAAGYFEAGKAEQESVFHLFFRSLPFNGGYAISAGLEDAVRWLEHFSFDDEVLSYLSSLKGNQGEPLFTPEFLEYLKGLRWSCDVDAMAEGTLVFPHQPILRVKGQLLQAQWVETALLNIINFQTLIATRAARIVGAASGDPVLEFGLRRAQGPDGGLMASRAAYIGGCAATSNVLAGHEFGIPVKGTHAHSWVMSFDDELSAFREYAEAMPDNCVLLVDTFDTLAGVEHAIEIGRELRQRGHQLAGIRLDSGDLAWLSKESRKRLDEAGFEDTAIVASNDLDEETIESLRNQGAKITVWGVGTRMVTGGEQSALGGVYKLGALRDEKAGWIPKMKLSEERVKVSQPGILQVRRFREGDQLIGDAIYDEERGCPAHPTLIDPSEPLRRKVIAEAAQGEDLLVPLYRKGELVAELPSLDVVRDHAAAQLTLLDSTIRRIDRPHRYPAGLESGLYNRKQELLDALET